jgi:hypothetical protein
MLTRYGIRKQFFFGEVKDSWRHSIVYPSIYLPTLLSSLKQTADSLRVSASGEYICHIDLVRRSTY